jgi:hypothetical protein
MPLATKYLILSKQVDVVACLAVLNDTSSGGVYGIDNLQAKGDITRSLSSLSLEYMLFILPAIHFVPPVERILPPSSNPSSVSAIAGTRDSDLFSLGQIYGSRMIQLGAVVLGAGRTSGVKPSSSLLLIGNNTTAVVSTSPTSHPSVGF